MRLTRHLGFGRAARGAVLLSLLLLGGCLDMLPQELSPLRVSLDTVQVLETSLADERYRLLLRIQNPNPFPLPVQGMSFQVALGGQALAPGLSSHSFDLPAYSEVPVEVDVGGGTPELTGLIRTLSAGGAGILSFSIDGEAGMANDIEPVGLSGSGQVGRLPDTPKP